MGFRCASLNVDKLAEQLNLNSDELRQAVRNASVGGYARLWSFEDKGNFGTGRVSVSSRKDQNSEYETQFQDGFVCLSGGAYDKAKALDISENGVSIVILSCDVRNKYDETRKKMFTNFYIYDFDVVHSGGGNSSGKGKNSSGKTSNRAGASNKPAQAVDNTETETDEDELPF